MTYQEIAIQAGQVGFSMGMFFGLGFWTTWFLCKAVFKCLLTLLRDTYKINI